MHYAGNNHGVASFSLSQSVQDNASDAIDGIDPVYSVPAGGYETMSGSSSNLQHTGPGIPSAVFETMDRLTECNQITSVENNEYEHNPYENGVFMGNLRIITEEYRDS